MFQIRRKAEPISKVVHIARQTMKLLWVKRNAQQAMITAFSMQIPFREFLMLPPFPCISP